MQTKLSVASKTTVLLATFLFSSCAATATNSTLQIVEKPSRFNYDVHYSRDGKTVAGIGSDKESRSQIKVWNSRTRKRLMQDWISKKSQLKGLVLSPDLRFYVETNEEWQKQYLDDEYVGRSRNYYFQLFDIATRKRQWRIESSAVAAIAFSPRGDWLATSESHNTNEHCRLVRVRNGTSDLIPFSGRQSDITFSPDGTKVAACKEDDGVVSLFDIRTRKIVWSQNFEAGRPGASSIAFSPDGKLIACGYDDGTIRLWNASSGKLEKALKKQSEYVWKIKFSSDSQIVASGSNNGLVVVRELESGKQLRTIKLVSSIVSFDLSPDGATLVVGSRDGTVALWQVK